MRTRTIAFAIAALGALAVPAPAGAGEPSSVEATYFLHWNGDCGGSGFMDFLDAPSNDSCALFFPVIAEEPYAFPADEGVPFVLDAARKVKVKFLVTSVASVEARFDVTVSGLVNGVDKRIAAGSKNVTAALGRTRVELELPADAALQGALFESLTFTVKQGGGVTYSSIFLTEGYESASMSIGMLVDSPG